MIHNTLIWTKRGWLKAEELVIGDVVISYNPSRNCTEYDSVAEIKLEYGIKPIYGVKSHSLNWAFTPEHPFIVVNNLYKTIERFSIEEKFLTCYAKNKSILYTSPFEPYLVSNDLDDVAWSARLAASFGNNISIPIKYQKDVWDIIENISGVESMHWIDTFFHWGILEPGTYWSKATKLHNKQVRDMVYHVAPRAGFGTRFMRNPKRRGQWMIGLSTQNKCQILKTSWYRDRVEGYFFNIKTKNGSFLGRAKGGTFLCPCDLS